MFNMTLLRTSLLSLLGALALPAVACTAPVEDELAEAEIEAEVASASDPGALTAADDARAEIPVADYFIVTRPDTRRCVSPLCGGYFVARVNTKVTQCADGTTQPDCHMLDLDLSKLRLDPAIEAKAEAAFNAGQALVRGALRQVDVGAPWPADVLFASEIWIGVTGTAPKGHFSRIDDAGLVCVTYPCPTLTERRLNTRIRGPLDSIDLSPSGATQKQIDLGLRELYENGLLAAGHHTEVTGPAGSMNGFAASEFYVRVK